MAQYLEGIGHVRFSNYIIMHNNVFLYRNKINIAFVLECLKDEDLNLSMAQYLEGISHVRFSNYIIMYA